MKPTKLSNFKKSLSNNFIFSETLFSLIVFFIIILIISNPTRYSKGTIDGLTLFINSVLPGLFPFMFLTKLLTEIGFIFKISKYCDKFTNKIFGTPGVSLYAFLMSILSGYPIGAKIISDLYEKNLITNDDAKKMSIFCTTSGPIFVIGSVGSIMFGEYKIGLILYASHILSSIIIGIFYNLISKSKKNSKKQGNKNFIEINSIASESIFSNCISQTINSIFIVGAYITIFYLIGEICNTLKIIDFLSNSLFLITQHFNMSLNQCKSFIYGLIEVTRGCKSFSINFNNVSIALCSGIISFSGLSIIMQSMAFLKNTKIKMHQFLFNKLMHMIISIMFCYLLLIIFM